MAPPDNDSTLNNPIVDARSEAVVAASKASFGHATALVAEIRLRDARIESLERSNQELITLRDRYAYLCRFGQSTIGTVSSSLLAMSNDAPRSAVPLHDVSVQAKLTRLEHLELLAVQQEQELAALQSKYSEALNYLGTYAARISATCKYLQ